MMATPEPTPKDPQLLNEREVEVSKSVTVLHDRIESYRRPCKLYGRDQDLEILSTVYHRFMHQLRQSDDTITITASEFILIHGDSGIGKSALIQHFFMNHKNNKPLTDDLESCFCIVGEFDQQINLRTPNGAFLNAFASYVFQIKERALVERFRMLLQQSSIRKDEIDVLVKMIPTLSDLFDRPESPTVQFQRSDDTVTGFINVPFSSDDISAFKYALLKFLRVVATKTHPIVLVLEDVHHADESALNLMTFLMNHTSTNAILFIGTTRDDVNSESLEIMLRKLSSHETVITHVRLNNLDTMSTMAMISDVLDMTDRNLLHTILEIIKKQCLCNPYGILTFLSALARHGCWNYDRNTVPTTWQSYPTKLQYFNNKRTRDVISEKLALLPLDVLQSLQFASLFGTKIDVAILSQLMNVTQAEILSYLSIATENGFITRIPSEDFSFAHEVIVDTLTESMPAEEREEFHYKAGRRLWQCYDLEELDENIHAVVRLLLVGERYIVKDRERIAVAKLCLRSGEKSVHISSFRTALRCIMSGITLAGNDCWQCEYQLTLDLHNAAAELAYCTGKGSTALDISNTIAVEARCFDDALTGHDIKIRALGAVGKVQESRDFGLKILLLLGEVFPAKPSMARCYIGLQTIRKRLKRKSTGSLLRLPLMTDRRKIAAVKMMNQLFTICLQLDPLMAILLAFRVVSLTLDFGISATSSLGFVTLGAILAGPVQDVDEGYRLGQVGMAMYEKFKIKVWLAPLSIMYYLGIHTFKHKLSSILEPMQYAAQIGEETGNIEESTACELALSLVQLESRSLVKSVNSMSELRNKMLFYGLTTIHELSTPTFQSLQTLVGHRDMKSLTIYKESDGLIYLFNQFHVMMLSLVFGDVETASKSSKQLRAFSAFPVGGVDAAFIAFLDGLTTIRMARRKRKMHNMKYCMKKVKQLTTFAAHAPDLFLSRLYLLEAEIASLMRNKSAYSKYVAAIALAKDSGSFAVAALGNESAGHYFLDERQDAQVAEMHFQQAIYFYELWGATTKVAQLTLEVQTIFKGNT